MARKSTKKPVAKPAPFKAGHQLTKSEAQTISNMADMLIALTSSTIRMSRAYGNHIQAHDVPQTLVRQEFEPDGVWKPDDLHLLLEQVSSIPNASPDQDRVETVAKIITLH